MLPDNKIIAKRLFLKYVQSLTEFALFPFYVSNSITTVFCTKHGKRLRLRISVTVFHD
jgi:hypothetical protein